MSVVPYRKVGRGSKWLLILAPLAIITVLLFGCGPSQFNLTTSCVPDNGGTVSPGSGIYDRGAKITLIATPAKYYRFNGWGGDVSESADRVTITMNSNKIIVASFMKIMYDLQLSQNLSNGGKIEPKSGSYEAGNQVGITAIPATGYRFDRWTGSLSGTSNPLDLLMDANKSLTANFVKIWNLSATCSPDGSGSINPGSGTYDDGAKLMLTATAKFPYAFDHWSGSNNDKSNPTSVTISADKSVTGNFRELSPGPEQSRSVEYYGWQITYPVNLKKGQWIQGGMRSDKEAIPLYLIDPLSNVVLDLGKSTSTSFTYQAQMDGTHNIILGYSSVFWNFGCLVTWTIYE